MSSNIFNISDMIKKRNENSKSNNTITVTEIIDIGDFLKIRSLKNEILNNIPTEKEDLILKITSNAVSSILMSLEEDDIDSEHPLIIYEMVPEVFNIVKFYVNKMINKS
ncbi:MAG: hypothetical protein NZZ41_03055 [Candidatus Dojkabacteria bacterium]|nr:hypothetical protein [Candidatus Dojkabacteria bacterium]